jgi:hypothetical protein
LNPGKVDTLTKTSKLSSYTRDPELIFQETWKLFQCLKIPVSDVRGVGLQLSDFGQHQKVDRTECMNDTITNMLTSLSAAAKTLTAYFTKIDPSSPTSKEGTEDNEIIPNKRKKNNNGLKQLTITSLFKPTK